MDLTQTPEAVLLVTSLGGCGSRQYLPILSPVQAAFPGVVDPFHYTKT
jgi:hypothetical protein